MAASAFEPMLLIAISIVAATILESRKRIVPPGFGSFPLNPAIGSSVPAHLTLELRAGAAFIGLAGDERAQFFAEVERLTTSWASFKSSQMKDVKWCHPRLIVEVKHLAGSKTLRHATVRSFAR
jgi:hypothetical protein